MPSHHDCRAAVSQSQVEADLDTNANGVLIEKIKIENEGWQRDAVTEPPNRAVLTELS